MKIMHKNIKYVPQTLSDSGNLPVVGNRGRRSEWRGQIFDRKFLNSRSCACAVKICPKVS